MYITLIKSRSRPITTAAPRKRDSFAGIQITEVLKSTRM